MGIQRTRAMMRTDSTAVTRASLHSDALALRDQRAYTARLPHAGAPPAVTTSLKALLLLADGRPLLSVRIRIICTHIAAKTLKEKCQPVIGDPVRATLGRPSTSALSAFPADGMKDLRPGYSSAGRSLLEPCAATTAAGPALRESIAGRRPYSVAARARSRTPAVEPTYMSRVMR
jgi:hypothetical protein